MQAVTSRNEATSRAGLPVDGHVHFHDLRRVSAALDAAAANFAKVSDSSGGFLGVLLLAQTAREQVFEALCESGAAGDWLLTPVAGEPETLIARLEGQSIVLVCGRQVRSDEGLEVLALGTCEVFSDGLPLEEAFAAVQRTAALPVIPWGLGKLLGARGRRVDRLLAACGRHTLFIGDNGSRLHMLGTPVFIRSAARRGLRILPGTDPFPIGGDFCRVGRFGFLADLRLSTQTPWGSLRAWLTGRTESPTPYGRACDAGRFLRIQIGIQAYNRLRRRSAA